MVIEKNIRKHDFMIGGPKWIIEFNPNFIPRYRYVIYEDPLDFTPNDNIVSNFFIRTINNSYFSTITNV